MRSSLDVGLGDLDPRELFGPGPSRFLDFYGDHGLETALTRYGFFDALRRRGFDRFAVETHADDERHTLIVTAEPRAGGARVRLVDLVVRRDRMIPRRMLGRAPMGGFDVLTVDWLGLRDPTARFTADRPCLPGQDAPGLGVGERVLELLFRAVARLRLDALVTVAAYFHNAVLYRRELPFLDPAYDGQLRALMSVLMDEHGLTLAQASWAIDWDLVTTRGAPFRWTGQAQVWCAHPDLGAFVASAGYRRAAMRAARFQRFALDRAAFDRRWADERDALEGRE
jgi:hypothetical protein